MINLPDKETIEEPQNRVVLRISTGYWSNDKGLFYKRELKFLKKKTYGYNFLLEDSDMTDTKNTINHIVNLDQCDDGVYEVVIDKWTTDWETGNIEEITWKLIPYKDDNEIN